MDEPEKLPALEKAAQQLIAAHDQQLSEIAARLLRAGPIPPDPPPPRPRA